MPDHSADFRDKFPAYDVTSKRHTPSWNDKTRQVIDARLATPREPRFLDAHEFATVDALASRIVPQPVDRPPIPIAALVDAKLHDGKEDGFRADGMPRERDAWRQGIAAIDAEAREAYGRPFRELDADAQDTLLTRMQEGTLSHEAWGTIEPKTFFTKRLGHDIVFAYYAHPTSWNEIGWGGPASPRGYVRMGANERDPWEAAEVKNGDVTEAWGRNRRVG